MIVSDREMLFTASKDKIIYDIGAHSRCVSRMYLHRLLREHIFMYVNKVSCTTCDEIYLVCIYVCISMYKILYKMEYEAMKLHPDGVTV